MGSSWFSKVIVGTIVGMIQFIWGSVRQYIADQKRQKGDDAVKVDSNLDDADATQQLRDRYTRD